MEWFIFISVGLLVAMFGIWFLRRHNLAIVRFQTDHELTEKHRDCLVVQHKRRRVASSLLIVVGLMIPLSYYFTSVIKNPVAATLVLLAILVLLLFIFLIAISDILLGTTVREDLQLKKAETELKRRILEQELAKHQELRQKNEKRANQSDNNYRSNGTS